MAKNMVQYLHSRILKFPLIKLLIYTLGAIMYDGRPEDPWEGANKNLQKTFTSTACLSNLKIMWIQPLKN